MTMSPPLVNRFLVPAVKVAMLSCKVTMIHFERGRAWALDTFERNTILPEALSSRRPCPACGGAMLYEPKPWSAMTGKYLRRCECCDYADARAVKIVQQI